MRYQLNPTVETFFLLFNPTWGKELKKEAIKQLDDFGINGAAFYAANFSAIEQYHIAFGSRMVETEGSALFEAVGEEQEFVFLLLGVLLSHPEWLDGFSTVSEEDAGAAVREVIIDFLESGEDIIGALDASGLSDQTKWQTTALLQQPKQRLTLVIDAINANRSAFEYAYSKVEAEITSLIARFKGQIQDGGLPAVASQIFRFNPKAQIIPSMAVPFGVMGFDDFTVYGLLTYKLFSGQDEGLTKEEALLVAKSLCDSSKLDILLALKKGSLYNLEIARTIGLTTATASHHMNMLLSAGLVEVSKREGKVYYSLSTDGLKRYRDWLDDTLL